MMTQDYEYIRSFIYSRSGILLGDDKNYLIDTRLAVLAQKREVPSVDLLVRQLREGRDPRLVQDAVDALTTNETYFFRDDHPFETLRDEILPELIAARRTERRLSIWSAACSTGQEPYTLAMMIRDHYPELLSWNLEIRATDLSNEALEQARSGVYSTFEIKRGLSPQLLARHFRQDGDRWRLDEKVRQMVSFSPFNLVGSWPMVPPADLVLLRNVLIYFDPATRTRILEGVLRVLRHDGYLLMGCAESANLYVSSFQTCRVGRTVLWRPAELRRAC